MRVPLAIMLAFIAIATMWTAPEPSSAAEAAPGDTLSIPLGNRGTGLHPIGVRLSPVKPAVIVAGRLVLPVADVLLPTAGVGQLVLKGGVKLTRGRRSTLVKGILVTVAGGYVKLTAKIGSRRSELLKGRAGGRALVDASQLSVSVDGADARLTARATARLRRALAERRFRAMSLGRLVGGAKTYVPPPQPSAAPANSGILPVAGDEVPRPVTAVDVTAASLRWWLRDSWAIYIADGGYEPIALSPATSHSVGGAAHPCTDVGAGTAAHVFAVDLPFASGWYDVASGRAALRHSGGARFYFPAHGIDISTESAELELGGTEPQAVFKFSEAGQYANRRAQLGSLSAIVPVPGALATYAVTLPTSTVDGVFAGFYLGGSGFGCFKLNFSVSG